MKRVLLSLLFIALLVGLMVAVALKVQIPLAVNSDFQVLYYTDRGLLRDIDVYDQESKIQMISEILGGTLETNFIPQFAYPPWFALSTFYLGLFSIRAAAVLWFEINLAILFLSVWFLTDSWQPLPRLLAFPIALFFYPVLGMLAIGQYDFPVLLGVSMLIYSMEHKQAVLTGLGMALLTFKPHLGGLILIAGLIYLFLRRDEFGKKALTYTIGAGVFLLISGFLADAKWPIHYLDSLLNYRGLGHITTCSECVNLPVFLARKLSGELSLSQAGVIGSLLLIVLILPLVFLRLSLWKSPALLLTSALMVTILASPYLYNYDFVLLLVPFAILLNSANLMQRIILILCYLAPAFAIIQYGRDGNISLILVTLAMAILLYLYMVRVFQTKNSVIDSTASAA